MCQYFGTDAQSHCMTEYCISEWCYVTEVENGGSNCES